MVLCEGREGKNEENTLSHDGVDGGGGTGVNSHRAATAAYRMIGPGMTDLMVLFDNQQFGNRTDRTRTSMGVQNVELQTSLVGNSVLRFRFLGLPEFGIPLPSSEFRNFPAENQIGKPENRSSRKSEFRFPFSGIPEFR